MLTKGGKVGGIGGNWRSHGGMNRWEFVFTRRKESCGVFGLGPWYLVLWALDLGIWLVLWALFTGILGQG